MPTLKDWHVRSVPELQLCGTVFYHDNQPDGKRIHTSSLVSYDDTNDVFVTKSGSKYHITQEDASHCYEAEYCMNIEQLKKFVRGD
jgi:hypothetical protein